MDKETRFEDEKDKHVRHHPNDTPSRTNLVGIEELNLEISRERETYLRVIGDKEGADKVASYATGDVENGGSQPPHSLLHVAQDEEGECERGNEMKQSTEQTDKQA